MTTNLVEAAEQDKAVSEAADNTYNRQTIDKDAAGAAFDQSQCRNED